MGRRLLTHDRSRRGGAPRTGGGSSSGKGKGGGGVTTGVTGGGQAGKNASLNQILLETGFFFLLEQGNNQTILMER